MRRLLEGLRTALVVVVVCVAAAYGLSSPAKADPGDAAVLLRLVNGYCSGTILAPPKHPDVSHTILTDTHCFTGSGTLVGVGDRAATALRVIHDGNDHALVTTDVALTGGAPVDYLSPIRQTAKIRYWGNPWGHVDVYREGYIMGACEIGKDCLKVPKLDYSGLAFMLSTPSAGGDSGAGVFDEAGHLIGTVTAIQPAAPTIEVTLMFPFAFTAEQWRSIQ